MTALLHPARADLAAQILARVVMGRTLTIYEMRDLAVALQVAAEKARAIEGTKSAFAVGGRNFTGGGARAP